MEESTALRKSEGSRRDPHVQLCTESEIDSAVISSVRRNLCRDRLKHWNAARLVAAIVLLKPPFHRPRTYLPQGSVGYNLNVSRVSVHASRRARTKVTPKRSMRRKRRPPKRVIISFKRILFVQHVSVNHPRRGGVERGARVTSAALSCPSPVKSCSSLKSWRLGKSPTKYKICRQEPLGCWRARDRRVGDRCPKHRLILGINLDT